jgi:hypothetical protein
MIYYTIDKDNTNELNYKNLAFFTSFTEKYSYTLIQMKMILQDIRHILERFFIFLPEDLKKCEILENALKVKLQSICGVEILKYLDSDYLSSDCNLKININSLSNKNNLEASKQKKEIDKIFNELIFKNISDKSQNDYSRFIGKYYAHTSYLKEDNSLDISQINQYVSLYQDIFSINKYEKMKFLSSKKIDYQILILIAILNLLNNHAVSMSSAILYENENNIKVNQKYIACYNNEDLLLINLPILKIVFKKISDKKYNDFLMYVSNILNNIIHIMRPIIIEHINLSSVIKEEEKEYLISQYILSASINVVDKLISLAFYYIINEV